MLKSIQNQIITFGKKILDKLHASKEEKMCDVDLEFSSTKEPVTFANRKKFHFQKIRVGEQWSNELFSCAWFHASKNIDFETKDCYFKFDPDGEGLIFDDNGTPLFGITNFCCVYDDYCFGRPGKIYLDLNYYHIDKKLDLWIDAANNDPFGNLLSGKVVAASITKIKPLFKKVIYDISFYLDLAIKTIDEEYKCFLLKELEKIFLSIDSNDHFDNLEEVSKELDKLKQDSDNILTLYSIGHAHLDLAWLWPIRETKRKCARAVASLFYFLEKYPDYIFGISQPQQLSWLKHDYPELFNKLKEYVAKGRVELQGAMWVESDQNMPCGESLIRQIYYGKKFWKEEFNQDVNNVFLPDCFGFPYSLPQIANACGLKHFLTIKLDRNEINRFPYTTFNWVGIDGSTLLTHFPPEADYNSTLAPGSLLKSESLFKEKDKLDKAIALFGIGDGGGGPNETHLEFMSRSSSQKALPKVKTSTVENYFNDIENSINKIPTYNDELYLEKHQGTLTSQAKNKYYNRKLENKLCCIESMMVLEDKTNLDNLEEYWKKLLLFQFHDILPGSSISRVYEETEKEYAQLDYCLENVVNSLSLENLGHVLYNSSPFMKNGYKEFNGKTYFYNAKPYSFAILEKKEIDSDVVVRDLTISNKHLTVKLDEHGNIISLISNKIKKDLIKDKTNFYIYNDNGGDCWDIYQRYYLTKKKKLILKDCSIYEELDRKGYTLTYEYNDSKLIVNVYLKSDKNGLFFDCFFVNHMKDEMLRFDINPSFHVDKVAFNLQYGHIYRSTREDNDIEKAKFEVCAHKFVDYSLEKYGVALINDSKYGFRVKNDLISMNLLRSQNTPCKNQDIGEHKFSFEIYPHENDLESSDVYKEAYNFNRNIIPSFNKEKSFDFISDNERIILDWIKPSFDGKGTILRLYNSTSKKQTLTLLNKTAYKVDALERNPSLLEEKQYIFKPFELLTLYISK